MCSNVQAVSLQDTSFRTTFCFLTLPGETSAIIVNLMGYHYADLSIQLYVLYYWTHWTESFHIHAVAGLNKG